jgi:hypothetical protein
MEHVKLNAGNVLMITFVAIVGIGAVGAASEYIATKTDVPVLTPVARGVRKYVGWSLHEAQGS